MKTIPLSKGHVTVVDVEDYDMLSKYSWWIDAYGYALTTQKIYGRKKNIRMHRMILEPPADKVVDHIDGDPLNNQKSNLRIVSQKQNLRNSRTRHNNLSGYKGVGWYKNYKKWQVRISVDGKQIHIGYFDDKHEAARAYNEAALLHYGEFAWLNDIREEDTR